MKRAGLSAKPSPQRTKSLTKAQLQAVQDGRVHDCPYNHPLETRCPNCASWPFKKGGAAEFVKFVRNHLMEQEHD